MDDVASLPASDMVGPSLHPIDPRMAQLVPIRLATTCREDSKTAIGAAVEEVIRVFHQRNDCGRDSVRVVIFTVTADLRAAKPATSARAAGWSRAQFLCLAEMPTDDDLARCIRALIWVERGQSTAPLTPVYLNGTQILRPDLASDALPLPQPLTFGC